MRVWRSGPLSAAGAARASPTDHPRQGESGGACSRERGGPGRLAAQSHPARVQRAACSRGSSPLASRWCSWWLPSGFGKDQPAPAIGHPRQARRLPGCPDPSWHIPQHAGWPPAPLILAGMSFVRARPSPFTPDWLPQGEPGALERVLGIIAGSCRSHGRAEPGAARPMATRLAGEDPDAVAHRAVITITADHPSRGDARVVRTTAWCGNV
jgi:hypothetical protein